MTRRLLITATLASALVLAACGSDSTSSDTTSDQPITITGEWARTSPMGASAGAVYLVMTSAVDDQLVGASVDSNVAGSVGLHETVMAEASATTDMMSSTDTAADAMTMRPVDAIALPAGKAVTLEPGGYHIMLEDLVAPLEVGKEITVTLTFDTAGTREITVPIRDDAP